MPTISPAPLHPRSVTIVPTATSGVHATQSSHTHGPTPTVTFKSDRQHKAPVGLIVGVAIAAVAALCALFLVRFLFIRRSARRAAFAAAPSGTKVPPSDELQPPPVPPSAPEAVELGHYPPTSPTHGRSASGSWPTPFSPPNASAAPGPASSPAARQAYLAAELRAAQAQLERGGRGVDVKATKKRIRELEERQSSAWALGLE